MKKLIILVVFFMASKGAFGQPLTAMESRFNFFEVSGGVGIPFVNNKAFDDWSEANYHRRIYNNVEENVAFNVVFHKYDFSLMATSASGDYRLFTAYIGHRLTTDNSPITSFLNFGFGGIGDEIYSLAPVNYTRTPDEAGQHMYLQSDASYLSLQSRNYLNNFSFNISRNRRVNFRSGFYVNFNYRPWTSSWQFGYDKTTYSDEVDEDGEDYQQKNVNFVGHKVNDVPSLANMSVDAGMFVSITLSSLPKKHGYYSK